MASVVLEDLRGFVTLALAEEVRTDPSLLHAYIDAFDPGDDATLVVWTHEADAEPLGGELARVLLRAGVDPADCADILPWSAPAERNVASLVAHRVDALLSRDARVRLPIERPRYEPERAGDLRAFADRIWRAAEAPPERYTHARAVDYLETERGVSREDVLAGSIPLATLDFVCDAIADAFADRRALRALHVGNFVGLSLAHLIDALDGSNPGSTVVSVDPGVRHRGVARPQDEVERLLRRFGLHRRHVLVAGYSGEKSVGNDGIVYDGREPGASWDEEHAAENVLPSLVALGQRFEVAMIDGNHAADYLRREVEQLAHLLVPGGLLVLDDINECWRDLVLLCREVSEDDAWPFDARSADGRAAVLVRR